QGARPQRRAALAAHAVDERAVAAAEVAHRPAGLRADQLGVLPRHRAGQDLEVAVVAAADPAPRADRVRAAEAIDQPGLGPGRLGRAAHVVRDEAVTRRDVAGTATAQGTDVRRGTTTQTTHGPAIEPPRGGSHKPTFRLSFRRGAVLCRSVSNRARDAGH